MELEFDEYKVRKILNVHRHVDGPWFWGKYTAHPYVGCRSGCAFCYSRGSRYTGQRDPITFDTHIRVKINSVERLQKELPKQEKDIITVGDWQQPAEKRYRLSRGMLKVVHEHRYPLFIVERSPLLTRDIDLLEEINRQTWVGVLFSISNLDPDLKQAFEPRSPGVKRRLEAMKQLADAGITVGTSMMPIIPFSGDSERQLEELIRATGDHGGTCVLSGGMTMDGVQAEYTLAAARRFDPSTEARWRKMFAWEVGGKPNYGPPQEYNAHLGWLIRELCAKHGLLDRMPRYILPGALSINKRIAERLFLKTYDLELEEASNNRIWAYRRAAWTVDELPESIERIYKAQGTKGLQELPGIGKKLSALIAHWLQGNLNRQFEVGGRP
jgi:DNA repair photolyase